MADSWQLKAVLSAVDKMTPVLKAVAGTAKNTRKYLADVASSASAVAGHIGLPLALAGGTLTALSLGGIKSAVSGFIELGDQAHKSAQRVGVSTDEYQRLKYIAEQSGVSVEELSTSMGKLNKGIAMAANGKNKDLAELFKKAGISMRDANGNLRSSADLLPEVADLFARNGNAAIQARMGTALFGKGWQALAPLLQGGSEEVESLTERYKMLGIAMSEEALIAGEKFGDQLEDMHLVAKSFGNTIAAKLVPALRPMVEQLIQWSIANREAVATKIADFVRDLATELSKVDWMGFINGVKEFVSGLKSFVGGVGGAQNALIALFLFVNASAIMSLWQLGSAIVRLSGFLAGPLITALRGVAMAMSAAPVLALITAVVLLATMIYQNWDGIVAYVMAAWQRIKSVFDAGFFSGIIQVWLEAWQGLANGILGIIKTILPDKLMPEAFKNFNFSFATDRAANIAAQGPSPLVGPQSKGRVDGQVKISIDGLPQGSRVEQVAAGGDMPLDVDAGYRSYAYD